MSKKKNKQSSKWPVFSEEDRGGRIGVGLVNVKVHKLLEWVFRETSNSDIGIDGQIEVRESDKTSHGRLIGVQIKCGTNYLSEKTANGYLYRGDLKHLRYWVAYVIPVVVVLCDPESETCWWQSIDLGNVRFHKKGWSIEVPTRNELSATTADELKMVANRLQRKDIVELLFKDWLSRSFSYQIQLASIFAMPEDYHWLSMLGSIGEDYIMIDYLMVGVDGFDAAQLSEMLRWTEVNHKTFGYRRFLLAFISEARDSLRQIPDPPKVPGVLVEYVPLLLDLRSVPTLSEFGKDGRLIEFYEQGAFLDGNSGEVERSIKQAWPE